MVSGESEATLRRQTEPLHGGRKGPRVALLLPSLGGGGAERVILDLAGSFVDRGFAVDLVLVRAEGPYLQHLAPGVKVVDLQAHRTASSLLALARYLRRARPDALLSTLEHTNVVALMARSLAGVPLRVVIREANTGSRAATDATGWSGAAVSQLMRRLYPRADAIVAVSEGVAQDLALTLRLSPELTTVIYNPVLTPRLFAMAGEDPRHAWFEPGEPPVVLGVGRLAPQKDFPTLLRAFAALREDRPARLMILGEGEERPRLEALARELGLQEDVSMPGFVDNPFMYMARAGVFVLSSAYEGLPNVLIQAMATGTPAVATDCPSGPREILQDGKYGRLVPVGDAGAMAQAMACSLDEPRGVPDPAWTARYRLDTVAEQYLQVLGLRGLAHVRFA